jgi:hypothetical protein
MKKFLVIFGSFILFFFSIATMFRLMHWPGAAPIFVVTLFLFCIGFLPFFFIQRIIENKSGLSVTTNILGLISTFGIFMGVLFKMMHWPGGALLIIASTMLLFLPTLVLYAILRVKEGHKFMEFGKTMFLMILAGVFILFWGVSISRSILVSYTYIEDTSLASNKSLQSHNNFMLQQIAQSDSGQFAATAGRIHKHTNDMLSYVEDIKKELIARLGGDEQAINDHWYLVAKDNYDAPSHMLAGYGQSTGDELLKKLNSYRDLVSSELKVLPAKDSTANFPVPDLGIDTSVREELSQGYTMKWNEAVFDSQPAAAALAILSAVQNQLLNAEFKSLSTISMQMK